MESYTMKYRYLAIIICICMFSLLMTGCNKDGKVTTSKVTDIRKYGFQPPIEELYWGMSMDEIEETLGIEAGVDGVVYNYESPFTTITLKDKIKEFGYEATVSLEVCDEPDHDWYPYKSSYLCYVKLTYNDIDGKKVRDNINKIYSNSGRDWVDQLKNTCTTWLSEDNIKDIEPDTREALETLWDLCAQHTVQPLENRTLPSKEEDENINYISIVYSDQGAVVTFAAETNVQINQIITHK